LTSITHPVMKLPGIIRSQERIPMSGFYEWRQMEDGKQPFFISAKALQILFLQSDFLPKPTCIRRMAAIDPWTKPLSR
jgi:hypothetical protein